MIQQEHTGTWHTIGKTAAIPRFQLDYHSFGDLFKLTSFKSRPSPRNSRFASYLALYLPEVAARIDESDFGTLHLEVGALKLATRDAIAKRDWHTVCTHFAFIADLLETAGTELHDAISVSYLGNLLYGETSINYAKARTLLPRSLTSALDEIERHYEQLAP